jgi:hypothetical protein
LFLAGFPRDFSNPATISDYPQGLKIMTQYVLLPLVTLYLLILYAYLAKVIFTAHWPSGWVAYLVLAATLVCYQPGFADEAGLFFGLGN